MCLLYLVEAVAGDADDRLTECAVGEDPADFLGGQFIRMRGQMDSIRARCDCNISPAVDQQPGSGAGNRGDFLQNAAREVDEASSIHHLFT